MAPLATAWCDGKRQLASLASHIAPKGCVLHGFGPPSLSQQIQDVRIVFLRAVITLHAHVHMAQSAFDGVRLVPECMQRLCAKAAWMHGSVGSRHALAHGSEGSMAVTIARVTVYSLGNSRVPCEKSLQPRAGILKWRMGL